MEAIFVILAGLYNVLACICGLVDKLETKVKITSVLVVSVFLCD
jgi:hypothetical protein